MSKTQIDTELLISLVAERPMLWDKTLDLYRDKRRTFEAWREIFTILNDKFEKIGNTEKNEYGHMVMKKWTAMRDCWMKCHRRLKTARPNSGYGRKCKKYIYYDEMIFLSKIATRQDFSTRNPSNCDDKEKDKSSLRKKKRKKVVQDEIIEENNTGDVEKAEEPIGIELIDSIEESGEKEQEIIIEQPVTSHSDSDTRLLRFKVIEPVEESRTLAFFKGIAPIVDKFTDDEMVDFQFEVIKAMRNIQKRKAAPQLNVESADPLEYKPDISTIELI